MKIAFIGDSYSAYHQTGQETNHWSYLLSQHFPKHQYINYSTGGRGYDYYRLAMLDAKMKDVDIVLTNETFNQRILSTITGDELFTLENEASSNYKTYTLSNTYWYSIHSDELMYYGNETIKKVPNFTEKALLETLRNTAASSRYHLYNKKWWDNVDKLYNFKHIIKLNLLADPNKYNDDENIAYAYIELMKAYGIHQVMQRALFDKNEYTEKEKKQLLLDNDLIISMDDDHWSPKANKWVFHNYILPKVIDILS